MGRSGPINKLSIWKGLTFTNNSMQIFSLLPSYIRLGCNMPFTFNFNLRVPGTLHVFDNLMLQQLSCIGTELSWLKKTMTVQSNNSNCVGEYSGLQYLKISRSLYYNCLMSWYNGYSTCTPLQVSVQARSQDSGQNKLSSGHSCCSF